MSQLCTIIEPPKGTRDFSPVEMTLRKEIIDRIEKVFQSFGASTIQTPVFERKDLLLGKYGDQQKLVYDLADQGGTELSLRYDLTVPLARYVATHSKTNFKRYCIDRVYRRDNPSISQGRFREFYQCDYDILGKYDSMVPDAEVIACVSTILNTFDFKYTIKINDKRLLDYILLKKCHVPIDKLSTTCSSIDKLDKESWIDISSELKSKGLTEESIELIGQYVLIKGNPNDTLKLLCQQIPDEEIKPVFDELKLLFSYLTNYNILNVITLDMSLARGLSYYTGIIFEAVVIENGNQPGGSIAGGGRYDNLINMFAKNRSIPAVGASIGIERIFAYMNKKDLTKSKKIRLADVYIAMVLPKTNDQLIRKSIIEKQRKAMMQVSSILRNHEFRVEMSYVSNQDFKAIFSETSKNNIPYVVIVAENELDSGNIIVKNVETREQQIVKLEEVYKSITK